uniref:lymphoid enhancer-binding factor 1-like isoform X2 n=1 Tax=Monopterus albus TaxID=43700 RepID=UPI0009B4E62A|nr:lymphoid enhancer-binding factor 1-like isoform X2 [Monopterus albus]
MLFRKEQALNVVAELHNNNSAQVYAVLGQRWKAPSKEEQPKYDEEAELENVLHVLHHPNLSSRDNYNKSTKRVRRRPPTKPEAAYMRGPEY